MASEICPEARGFIPQELTCQVRVSWDRRAGVGFWKRLWRSLTGYYDCPNEGLLPCSRFRDTTNEAL